MSGQVDEDPDKPKEDPLLKKQREYDQILFTLKAKDRELVAIFENTMGMPLVSWSNRLNIIAEATEKLVPQIKEEKLKVFLQKDNPLIPKEIDVEKMSFDQFMRTISIFLAQEYPEVMERKMLSSQLNQDVESLWNKVDSNKQQLEGVFKGIFKEQEQFANQTQTIEILQGFSVFLGFDCEPAQYYFIRNSPHIPDWMDLNRLPISYFLMIFKLWVKDSASIIKQTNEQMKNESKQIENWVPELESGFNLLTKDSQGKIDLTNRDLVKKLLERWTIILSMDMKEFNVFLQPTNKSLPKEIDKKPFDLQVVQFAQMMKLYEMWRTQKTQAEIQKSHSPNHSFLGGVPGDRPYSNNDSMARSSVLSSDTYQRNRKIVDEFLAKFKQDVYSYFCDFSREKSTVPIVLGSDVPLIMRVAFYIDNITFHLGRTTREEAFNTPNFYKLLLEKFKQYYGIRNQIDYNDVDPTEVLIPFDTFVDFIYFYLQRDEFIYLRQTQDFEWREDSSTMDISRDDPLVRQYRDNIDKYQKLLNQSHIDEEKKVLKKTVNNLQQELDELTKKKYRLNRSSSARKASDTAFQDPGLLRDQNLKEVFEFYCQQMYTHGPRYSFERHERELSTLNIANWLLFCKQFSILNFNKQANKIFLQILFKKTGALHHELNYDEFQVALYYLAVQMFKEHGEKYPTDMEKYEGLLQYLSIDDRKTYYSRMKLLQPPFNIQEKQGFRLLPKDKDRPVKMRKLSPKTQEKLKQYKMEMSKMIEQIKQDDPRLSAIPGIQGQYLTPQYALSRKNNQSMPTIQALQNSIFNGHGLGAAPTKHYIYDTYAQRQAKSKQMIAEGKISWQQLEKLTFNDMNRAKGPEAKFQISDLVDENEDADDEYFLAEYNLAEDKRRKEEQAYLNMKGQQTYGVVGRNQRGSNKLSQPLLNVGMSDNHHKYHHIADDPYMYGGGGSSSNVLKNQSKTNQPVNRNDSLSPPGRSNIGQNYQARAAQLDYDEKKKDQEMMNKYGLGGEESSPAYNQIPKGYNSQKR